MAKTIYIVAMGIALCMLTMPMLSNTKRIHRTSESSGKQAVSAKAENSVEDHNCGEPAMNGICVCQHVSYSHIFTGSYQCSECIDPSKWGYGCELDCPRACPRSCDFSGNCIATDPCPKRCKRNSRVEDRTEKDFCVNSQGQCQACDSGYYGEMCTEKCPANCDDSTEGYCARMGSCYKCKEGYYGKYCEDKCPDACPQCLMKEGVNAEGEKMPAGSCTQPCTNDNHGRECNEACPTNCDRSAVHHGRPSCSRDEGHCKRCMPKFWGATCKNKCQAACVGGKCRQWDGHCEHGCNPGFWGASCEKECPKFSDKSQGCEWDDGYPASCDAKHFPAYDQHGSGVCQECPARCEGGLCGDKGKCTNGCVKGFHGATCIKKCDPGCDDAGCDWHTGQCKACKDGFTGSDCSEKCHSHCATCVQFGGGGAFGIFNAGGTSKEDCLSCPEAEASELVANPENGEKCGCIGGAERTRDGLGKCECTQPTDPVWEANFETNPKKCNVRCKENYNGKPLRPVSGKGTTKCIYQGLYNAVAAMWSQWYTGPMPKRGEGCIDSEDFPIVVDEETNCLHKEFIVHIVGQAKFDQKTPER